MNRDRELAWAVIGLLFGMAFVFFMYLMSNARDNHNFIKDHEGIRAFIQELQDECESEPGVVECEWTEDGFIEVSK